MLKKCFTSGRFSEAERRLTFFAGPEDLYVNIKPEMTGNHQEFRDLIQKTPDAQPVFDAMHELEGESLTIDHLAAYIEGRVAEAAAKPLNSFELDLEERLDRVKNAPDAGEKLLAERSLNALVQYIQKYNTTMTKSQQRRADFRQQEKLPEGIGAVTGAVKSTLSAHLEGFKNANGQDRAVMLAGVIVSVLVLKGLWDRMAASTTGPGAVIKNLAGITIGGGALWLAYEAANRNAKIVSKGKINHPFGRIVTTNPNVPNMWGLPIPGVELNSPLLSEDQVHEQELDRITTDLRKQGIPPGFIDQMLTVGGKKEKKFMAGVAVLSSLRVNEAQELYEKYKDSGEIPEEDWPSSRVVDNQKDPNKNMTPTERFALLEEMGEVMGLIKGRVFTLPSDPARQNKTLLYLIATGVNIT